MFKGLKNAKIVIALLLSVIIAFEPVSNVVAVEAATENVVADIEADETEQASEEILAEETEASDETEDSKAEEIEETEIEESEDSDTQEEEDVLDLEGEELLEETEIEELPASYVLTQARIEEKAEMSIMEEDFRDAVEGIDYVSDEVFFLTDSLSEAEIVAEAYGGELGNFESGVAVIKLEETEVKEAFAAAKDMSINLPAVYPNYYRHINDETVTVTSDSSDEKTVVEAKDADTNEEAKVLLNDDTAIVTEEVTETSDSKYESVGAPSPAVSGYYDDPMLDPNDTMYQWHHATIGSSYAWEAGITGSGIKVMVIDTGIISSHEDLPSVTSLYYANDGEFGFSDGVDEHCHGTFVCSEIAAVANNSLGGVGVAPDVTLYSYRAGNENGSFSDASLIAGINKAVELGVDVINMSLGGPESQSAYTSVFQNTYDNGVIVLAAAGNENTTSLSYPAACDHVISVAATDAGNGRALFSNYGNTVDVSGPGYNIYSASYDGSYDIMNGTSMACPIAAAETALVIQGAKLGMVKNVAPAVAETRNGKRVDAIEKALKASSKRVSASGMGSGIPYLPTALGIDTATQKPAVPIILVDISPDNQSVTFDIINSTGKTICYTTDGSKPTYPVSGTTLSTSAPVENIVINDRQKVNLQAIAVNSAGEFSAIKKVSVTLKPYVSTISLTGPTKVAKGKKVTLSAAVAPNYATNKKLEWRFVSRSDAPVSENITVAAKAKGVTVSNGNVSATKTAVSGKYYLRAIAVDRKTIEATFPIDVVDNGTVSKMLFSGRALNVNIGSSSTVVDLMDTSSQVYLNALDLSATRITDGSEFVWTSSNPAVVTVDADGVATFVGGGKATVSAVSNDGNVVKATLNVTATQLPTSISLESARKTVAAGKALQLQATVYPATAANKKVTWEPYISGKTAAEAAAIFAEKGVKVSATGKITTTKNTPSGYYRVICRSVAASGVTSAQCQVTVKTGAITGVQANKKALNVFRVPGNYSASTSGTVDFTVIGTGDFDIKSYKVTSSNPNLVGVSSTYDGNVVTVTATATGSGIGKATINFESTDGTGKKASCTVNVINPASELLLGAEGDTGYWVAPGKTIQIKSVLGTDFGKISNSKINWSVPAAASSFASVSSTGRVSIKKDAPYCSIPVIAVAADGSGASSTIRITVNTYPTTVSGLYARNSYGYIRLFDTRTTFLQSAGSSSYWKMGFSGSYAFRDMQVTSSNPKLATAYYVYDSENDVTYLYVYAKARGNVTITVKPIDGYGKAAKFKFKIQ